MKSNEVMLTLLIGALFLAAIGSVRASDDVPALLRYAQQYDADNAAKNGGRTEVLTSPREKSRKAALELQRRQLTARVKALTAESAVKDRQLEILRHAQQASTDDERAQVKTLTAQLAEKNTALTGLQDKQQGVMAQMKVLTATLEEKGRQLADLAGRLPVPVVLDTARARQAYATGVLFGRDMQDARDANRKMGLTLDDAPLLAGLTDALTGHPKMDADALEKAQEAARNAAENALASTAAARKKADAAWVANFIKQKGSVRAPQGYWYRVDREGEGARLTGSDTVSLVVTERLTDATVVSDMEGPGSTLTEKVSALPMAFAGALGALKNHGVLTLVVPPALAYGDKGYPPTVLPGATLVYTLRVADVKGVAGVKNRVP